MQINTTAQFLEEVCKWVKCKTMHNDIRLELESHIDEIKQQLIDDGKASEEAERLAIAQMGSPDDIGVKLNKIHRPKTEWSVAVLAGVLCIIGFFSSPLSSVIYFLNIKRLIWCIAIGIVGISILLTIYLLDIRRIVRFSLPFYLASSILIISYAIYFKDSNNGFSSHLFCLAFVIAANIVFFSGSIYYYKDRIKIVFLHLIPIIATVMILYFMQGFVWALILFISYNLTLLLYFKKIPAKSKLSFAVLFTSIFALAGVVIIIIYEFISGRAFILPDILKNITNFNLIGRTQVNNYGLFQNGFYLKNILYNYGILFTGLILVLLTIFITRVLKSSKKIKDLFYKNMIITNCFIFILEIIIGFMNESGVYFIGQYYATSIFPFLSNNICNSFFNLILLAVILSCYRRKDITPKFLYNEIHTS